MKVTIYRPVFRRWNPLLGYRPMCPLYVVYQHGFSVVVRSPSSLVLGGGTQFGLHDSRTGRVCIPGVPDSTEHHSWVVQYLTILGPKRLASLYLVTKYTIILAKIEVTVSPCHRIISNFWVYFWVLCMNPNIIALEVSIGWTELWVRHHERIGNGEQGRV
jgi:hypothetical protein